MTASDTISLAWANLFRRKARTVLTSAGVVVGVAALVLMISIGLGLERQVLRQFESEDALRTLHVTRVNADRGRRKAAMNPFQMGGQIIPLTDEEVRELGTVPGVAEAVPETDMFLRLKMEAGAGTRSLPFAPVGGASPSEERRFRDALVAGALWSAPAERSCLIPRPLLDHQLGLKPEEALGAKVTFGGSEDKETPPEVLAYTCVGVFDPNRIGLRGRKIVVPALAAAELRDATRGGALSFVPYKKGTHPAASVRVADPRDLDDVTRRLRGSGYEVMSVADMIQSITLIFLVFEGFLASIGAIGLVVSLFGIANTMAMAVLERTREIGIMKALGARNREIGRLFLVEAGGIGILGGTLGLSSGWLTGLFLNWLSRKLFELPGEVSLFHVSLWLAGGSVAFSVFVSVVAGWLPARRAARMEPVAALRYE
jgi:putative ABC transport system permease protein